MAPVVQKAAPAFTCKAVMPDGSIKEVKLSDFAGKYVVLFFYPLDFTFVCPTEIVAFNAAMKEFQSRNVQVLGVSVDSVFCHMAWRNTELKKGGIGPIDYPLLSDITKQLSKDYGVLIEEEGIALRGLFLIDTKSVLRHMVINDLPIGRSIEEAIRVVDALQFHEKHGDVCPANWKKGAKAIQPTSESTGAYLASQH